MKYQKGINLFDNEVNLINLEQKNSTCENRNILWLKSILCDYSDAYRLVEGTITIRNAGAHADSTKADEGNKQVIFKNGAPYVT